MKENKEQFIVSLNYIRNNYFIDYSFNDDTFERYVCYIDSRNWFIIEYYLNWFLERNGYEFPDFYEIEFFDESKNYYGTNTDTKPTLITQEINLDDKLEDYVMPKREYKNILYKNNFEQLKKVVIY